MFKRSKRSKDRLLTQKLLALLLSITMIAGTLMLPVSSAELGETQGDGSEPESPFELPLLPGDLSPEEAKNAVLDMSTVPDVIGAADIAEQKHIKRLYEQEPDDYTIMFQNRDLSKTTYIFSVPVKNQSTAGTNEIMTVTSSAVGTAIVLNNAALTARLGNADVPGGLMPYNIGTCKIKSVSSGGVATQSIGSTASGIDVVDQIRDIAAERSAEQDGIVALSANITLEISDTSALSGGITYMVLNTSDIAGDYALKLCGTSKYLKNTGESSTNGENSANGSNLTVALGSNLPSSRWLIEASGGNKFLIRSQSAQTSYIMERSDGPKVLYYEYSLGHQWTISYEKTVDGTDFWSIVSTNGEYLSSPNGNVLLSEVADDVPTSALWGLMNKITCVDVQSISVVDHMNILVGDELDTGALVTYTPSNATYKGVVVGNVNSSILSATEENVMYDVLSAGVNKISITYAYEMYDMEVGHCDIISSTADPDIKSSYTYTLRTDTTDPNDALLLTLNVSQSNLSSTSLSLGALNDTWNYVSQACHHRAVRWRVQNICGALNGTIRGAGV